MLEKLIPSILNAVEESNYIVYLKDEHDNFLYMNKAASLALLCDIESIKNKSFLLGSKEHEIYKRLFENDVRILKSKEVISELYSLSSVSLNNPVSTPSEVYYFTKQPIYDQNTGQGFLLGFGVNVGAKLVQTSVLDFFKKALNSINDAFIITETQPPFRICYANDAFLTLTGYADKSNIIGKSPTEIVKTFSEDSKVREELNKQILNFEVCEAVLTNENIKGRKYKLHLKVLPLYYTNDRKPDYFIGIQRDITDVFSKNEILREKQGFLKAVYENVTAYLWLLSMDGKIVFLNKPSQIQGRYTSPEEVYNSKISLDSGRWFRVSEETQTEVREMLSQVKTTGEKASRIVSFLDSIDNVHQINLSMSISRNNEGNPQYIFVEGWDITSLQNKADRLLSIALASGENPLSKNKAEEFVSLGLSGAQLERVVKMETTIGIIVPQVADLVVSIKDPKRGLIAKFDNLTDKVSDLAAVTKDTRHLLDVVGAAKTFSNLLKQPIVMWSLTGLLTVLLGFKPFTGFILRSFGWEITTPSSNPPIEYPEEENSSSH